MHVLILGGTTEASWLAAALAEDGRVRATLSLAGRTRAPVLPATAYRVGGFGGAAGLAAWLRGHGVGALVDATHPFAAAISANAAAAAGMAGVVRVAVVRPAWVAGPGDRWTEAADMAAAASALGARRRRVFLTVGRQELGPFRAAGGHEYLVRSVDPPGEDALPAGARCIAARGPFAFEDEMRLLREAGIEMIVTKNSGAAATGAKLAAARALGIAVVMVARPAPPAAPIVETAEAALEWVLEQAGHAAPRGV